MRVLEKIYAAAAAQPRHIIMPEGDDPRVISAAQKITELGLAKISLFNGPKLAGIENIIPEEAEDLPRLAEEWHRMRASKGMDAHRALTEMRDPMRQAAMRVRLGMADGTVGGARATTADTVRAALQIIGKRADVEMVSSFFLMLDPQEQASLPSGLIFADCALLVDPDAQGLAAIALAASQNYARLFEQTPRVAMLSFSTSGSADHPSLLKIREAVTLVRTQAPLLEIDGEMQFDAALDDAIRAQKAPQSALTAQPNVFVFPDLSSGNIGYKIAQRLGGLMAIGPILQGLAKPANDLSRGCSAEDIVNAVAITALQCETPSPVLPDAQQNRPKPQADLLKA